MTDYKVNFKDLKAKVGINIRCRNLPCRNGTNDRSRPETASPPANTLSTSATELVSSA